MSPIAPSDSIPLRPVTDALHEQKQNESPTRSTSEARPAAATRGITTHPLAQFADDDTPPPATESATIAKGKGVKQVSGSPPGAAALKTNEQPSQAGVGLAARQHYSGMRFSVHKEPIKAVNQIFKISVSTGYKAFGKIQRDDFLSAFSPGMTWDVDQQFGGRRDDDPNERKTAISPEEIWDLYWHPLIQHNWERVAGPSSVISTSAPIYAEWNVMGYTQLLHENYDRMVYKAHVQDEYTVLQSGRLVISARVWRTVDIPLPNQYVSIRRPDEGAPWTPIQFPHNSPLPPASGSGTTTKGKEAEQVNETNHDTVLTFPAEIHIGLAAREHYINARLSVHNWPIKALNEIFKTSVSTGYKAFGKLTRDDFLSAFSLQMTWDVDQQFGGWRDDDPKKRKTSISPEEVWDLYWHPLIRHDWGRLAGPSSMALSGEPIRAEWTVIGYTRLLLENGDNVAYKAHVQDEYTILTNGRLVISARVWRTVTIPLPLHYVSIKRPDDGGQWSAAGEQEQPGLFMVIITLIKWLLRLKRWMAPMVAVAAIAASAHGVGISGSAGLVLAILGIFTAVWSLVILATDYLKDIITYWHGWLIHDWVRRYNSTINGRQV